MIFPCRCSNRKCRARRTLRKHPDDYVQRARVKCYHCEDGELKLDTYRQKTEHKKTRCVCDAFHYPHRYSKETCFRGKV